MHVITNGYKAVHGVNPSGFGDFSFQYETDAGAQIFRAPVGAYTQAKLAAILAAKASGAKGGVIFVCP
jgi:hypothetical protein